MNPHQTVTFITSDVMIHLCENTQLLSQHVVSDGGISHLRAVVRPRDILSRETRKVQSV